MTEVSKSSRHRARTVVVARATAVAVTVVIATVTWLGHEHRLAADDHRPVVTFDPSESGAVTPPWTLAEVFDRPCAVLTTGELDRFVSPRRDTTMPPSISANGRPP